MILNRRYYIDDADGEIKAIDDFLEWARWYESADRRVALSELGDRGTVSTVCLGIDHRFEGDGPPILYETMVFGGAFDQEQVRYCTRAEALAGHEEMVARISSEKT